MVLLALSCVINRALLNQQQSDSVSLCHTLTIFAALILGSPSNVIVVVTVVYFYYYYCCCCCCCILITETKIPHWHNRLQIVTSYQFNVASSRFSTTSSPLLSRIICSPSLTSSHCSNADTNCWWTSDSFNHFSLKHGHIFQLESLGAWLSCFVCIVGLLLLFVVMKLGSVFILNAMNAIDKSNRLLSSLVGQMFWSLHQLSSLAHNNQALQDAMLCLTRLAAACGTTLEALYREVCSCVVTSIRILIGC